MTAASHILELLKYEFEKYQKSSVSTETSNSHGKLLYIAFDNTFISLFG